MKIAVEGCAHGELDKIYETINYIESREKITVDLLICCGDFQSVRDKADMQSMAVPQKYQEMKDFSDYYFGRKKAPVLTLFIGGNHESANYLWELPYGGWVAENIYYLGYAGVVNFAGLRIGGISGIFKFRDYGKAHFERPPFNDDTKRSFYHVRNSDVAKMKLLSDVVFDVFLSHDWPKNIYNYGDVEQLLRFKPFLKKEIQEGSLGSNAAEDLLKVLKPKYWFSGHMHAKFSAIVQHDKDRTTKFLALDKCLPRRNFLQVLDFEDATESRDLQYDPYWLYVLKSCNTTMSQRSFSLNLPDDMKPTEFDIEKFLEENPNDSLNVLKFQRSQNGMNPQTSEFCSRFELQNPCVVLNSKISTPIVQSTPVRKMNLPTPSKMNLPTPSIMNLQTPSKSSTEEELDEFRNLKNINSKNTKRGSNHENNENSVDNDDFGELRNPNTSNQEDIDISGSSSSESSDDENDILVPVNSKPKGLKTPVLSSSSSKMESNLSRLSHSKLINDSFPSFVETPAREAVNLSSYDVDLKTPETSYSESGGEQYSSSVGTDSSSFVPSPNKKFKIVRRNQQLYTPSKDEE